MSSSARLSLGLIEHGNEFGRLDKDNAMAISFRTPPNKTFNAPHKTTRICVIKGDTLSVMQSFNTEYREHGRGHNKQRRINVVPPRADTLSKPKH